MTFDFKNPDYVAEFKRRAKLLQWIKDNPSQLPYLKAYYKDHIADFICDFGFTYDPRLLSMGRPTTIPFILFPKQKEYIEYVIRKFQNMEDGIAEKSRDMGLSWLSVAIACSLCIFNEGMTIGFGSRKEDLVDKSGNPDCLFWKARMFVDMLPKEFRGGFSSKDHSTHLRLSFPETNSTIIGEAGDNIGRGGRSSIYFVDEAAHIERPVIVDAALSQTTNCRIDISTPNGTGNPFAIKRFSGNFEVFSFKWVDDPRKDDEWYLKQKQRLDPITLAQEVDLDYSASVEGVVIPNAWVQAAYNAYGKLGLSPSGIKMAALDVADEGRDKNALCYAYGNSIEAVDEWSGQGGDIFATVQRAFMLCGTWGVKSLRYDSDGLGAGVRGDARIINESLGHYDKIDTEPFRGSAGVFEPEKENIEGRKNQDFFSNLKAQSWWHLRALFQNTYRAIHEGANYDADEIINISPTVLNAQQLMTELSQPTYSINSAGKIIIDKTPDGTKSPNLADAVMMRFAPMKKQVLKINPNIFNRI